jgi:hypothetical protein
MSDKPNKKTKPEKIQNSISESPINTFSETEIGVPSPFFTKEDVEETIAIDRITETLHNNLRVYIIDDLIDVWCRGVTNGATLWQYCQDTNKPLPNSFEAGLIELVNEIRTSENKPKTLQEFINNNMMLLGVFEEKQ